MINEYVGIIELKNQYVTVCKDENNLYYGGSVCNIGFIRETDGFNSIEELFEEVAQPIEND